MDEQLVEKITGLVVKALAAKNPEAISSEEKAKVQVKVSARHVHVTREVLDILYGKDHELTWFKDLMGGQFAAQEKVLLVSKGMKTIDNVRILGPLRAASQVEISRTDAVKLGVKAPLRESGQIKGSEPITLVGPNGSVALLEGCIVAKRHIHMNLEDARLFGVADKQLVQVKAEGERGGIFTDVLVRVDSSYTLEMHIDTDEANGLGIACGSWLELIKG